MTLSKGEKLTVANVIRDRISTGIVKQYFLYVKDEVKKRKPEFEPLSKSSLVKILKECPASTRSSMAGIDYIVAGGSDAFNALIALLDQLAECGFNLITAKDIKKKLKYCKQYLLSDYKAHVSSATPVASHCLTWSLSDAKTTCFSTNCSHQNHDYECDRCSLLIEILREIENAVGITENMSAEVRADFSHTMEVSKQAIFDLWAHQLRQINQDNSRIDDINGLLTEQAVHITLDFAMKWLPMKYRETSRDFYGKKGTSWHISFVLRKAQAQQFENRSFVHILEGSPQSSSTVYAIIRDIVIRLKRDMPHLNTILLRSDNASNYRSAQLLGSLHHLHEEIGVKITSYNFPDSQSGKGPCDRAAAHIKVHIKRYINEAHDVTDALEFLL